MESELPPVDEEEELSPSRVNLGLCLGLGGMIVYCLMLHLATVSWFNRRLMLDQPEIPAAVLPLVAAVGCVCFLAALMAVWRFRMLTLMALTSCSSLLVGLVVMAQKGGLR